MPHRAARLAEGYTHLTPFPSYLRGPKECVRVSSSVMSPYESICINRMALLALLALAAIAPALGNNDAGSLRISYPLGLLKHRPDWRSTKPSVNDLLYNADSYGHFMLAQFAEDAYIYENWFYGMENGVVVESGALNGLRYSTTFLLQYYAHWTPVHIEASPSNYDELIKLRPDSINVNAALCNMFQTLHYVESVQAPVKVPSRPHPLCSALIKSLM